MSETEFVMPIISETEFVMLLLGIGVLAVTAGRIRGVRRLRHWRLLATSYCFLLAGWSATVLEARLAPPFLNLFEHAAYAAGAVFAVVWCWLGPRDLTEAT